jgi:hypothetical protein
LSTLGGIETFKPVVGGRLTPTEVVAAAKRNGPAPHKGPWRDSARVLNGHRREKWGIPGAPAARGCRAASRLLAVFDLLQSWQLQHLLDLETVLATIVAKAVQLSNTDAGVIYVFDELDQTFRVRTTYGLSEELIATIQDQQLGASDAIRQATQDGQPKEMPDTRDEPPSLVREIAMRAGFRARLVVPLCASAAGCERVWLSGASFFNLAQ